jgi:hypothetical protein
LGTLSLKSHPDHEPDSVSAVEAAVIGMDANWLRVRWRIADSARVIVPPFAGKGRMDGLWQETCFELFIMPDDGEEAGAYVELNLSPSEQWAAYDFAAYRAGMAERPMPRHPDGTLRRGGNMMIFDASIPMAGLPPLPWRLGISAVIAEEDEDGEVTKSYWALRHGPGRADFHAPACFAVRLAAPAAA